MTTISAPHSTTHWFRWWVAIVSLLAALTVALVLMVSALADSGGGSRTGVPAVRPGGGSHTFCVPHGAARIC